MSDAPLLSDAPAAPLDWGALARLARALAALAPEARGEHLERESCRLLRVDDARYVPIARNLADMAERPGKGAAAFWETVARLEGPVVVSGGELEGLAAREALPAWLTDPRYASFVLVPLVLPGRAVGVLALACTAEREFAEAEAEALQALAAQAAAVLDAGTLAEENNYKAAYSRALGAIDAMIASHDVPEILRCGVQEVYRTLAAEKVLVFIVNPETGAVRLSAAEGCPYARESQLAHEPCARLAMQALKARAPQALQADGLAALAGVKPREGCTESQAIAAPIMAKNQLYGVLAVFDKQDGRRFHRNELAFVHQVASKLALVIQNAQAYLTINRLNEGLEEKVQERTAQLESAIASLKETQAQLMQSEKLATIGTLAGGVAHELNNPLAAILANIQLLKLDLDEDAEALDSCSLIETGARRCKQIVENLLNYARASGPEHRSLSLNATLEETLGLLAHRMRLASIEVVRDWAELPPVLGNPNELGQVFTNLVVNALDALAEQPAGTAVLTLRTRAEGKWVVAEVEDNGVGIAEAALRKIFDPFFTTKQVGQGTGLGLSVSQQIVAAHGGSLEAESRAGSGALFRVRLPVAHGAERGA